MEPARDDAVPLLRQNRLFADLPEAALNELASGAGMRRLRAGEWLFRQGDPGRQIFLVLSGRLEAVAETPPPERVLRALARGDVIGEVAFVTGRERSASVRARRDADLLEISDSAFADLVRRHSDVALELMRVLARRLARGPEEPTGSGPRTLAVIDLRQRPGVPLVASLTDAIGGNVATLDGPPPGSDPGRVLDELERKHDIVVLSGTVADPSEWLQFCHRQADRVVCTADAIDPPTGQALPLTGCDLALFGRPPGRIGAWLDAVVPRAHHWLDLPDADAGLARLVRRLLGRSTGVVLSGGGARGFAHIGVLQRLAERGIVVDRIGGCSMGSFIAGLAAVGMTATEMIEVCRQEWVRRNPLNDYTLPRVSVIRARKAAAMVNRVFGDIAIEHCATDYFCVSCDLVSAELVVHRRGRVAAAVSASVSLPGFAPPIASEGRLLVDGGVLDNLPVGVMAATGEGPVLAVDVMGRTRLGRTGSLPTLLETLTRTTVLASWQRVSENVAQAERVITPDVQAIGTLEFRRIDDAVEAGRRAVDAALG